MPTYTMIQARDRVQSVMAGVQTKHDYTLSIRGVSNQGRDSIEVVYRYRGSRFGDLQRIYGSSYKSAYDANLLNNAPSIVEHENAFKGEISKQCVFCCACM